MDVLLPSLDVQIVIEFALLSSELLKGTVSMIVE
jgi:hypothetical protein